MRPFSHVIFDLDGVLLDTEPLYTEATQRIVGDYGKRFEWSLKREMMGRNSLEAAEHLVRSLSLPISAAEFLQRSAPILESLFAASVELTGARALVQKLAERGVPMAIATSSSRRLYGLKSAHHDWFGVFAAVVCGDDPRIKALKPAPDIFLVAAEDLGATPEQCLVFEDSIAGVEAALAAGMQVIAVPDPNNDPERFSGAQRVIRGHAELDLQELFRLQLSSPAPLRSTSS